MNDFNINTPKNIVSGFGCTSKVETYSDIDLSSPVLMVTDSNLVKLGIATKIKETLENLGLEVFTFDQVDPEPNVTVVRIALRFVKGKKISTVIGLGGGSPMDIAKIIALLIKSPQPIDATYGVNNCKGERLPLILIPTTSGTGSEVTHVAVVTGDDGEKSPIVDTKLIGDVVLLDAGLTVGLPPRVTAATGIDAMVHAMEAFTSGVRKNIVSDQLAMHAFELLYLNISEAVDKGGSIFARNNMLTGSMLAGLAFANATVGAVHALSYPLGTSFHLPHGESNALVMVPVMRFNAKKAYPMYAELCRKVHPEFKEANDKEASELLLNKIAELIPSLGLNTSLSSYGIKANDLDCLTEGTLRQSRLLSYNFRKMEREDIYAIFKELL